MDVNELNKMNVVTQFNKLISQPNFIGVDGESFAGILEKNTSELPFAASKNESSSPKETIKSPANEKEDKVSAQEKPERKNKTEEDNKTDNEKDNKTDNEKNTKDDSKVDKKEDDVEKEDKETKASSREAVLPFHVACISAAVPAEEAAKIEEVESLLNEMPEGMLPENMQIIDDDGNVLSLSDLSLQDLSSEDSFRLFNAQTMEEIEVNGLQLSQIISKLTAEQADNMVEMAPIAGETVEAISSFSKKMPAAQAESVEQVFIEETSISEQSLEEKNQLDSLLADKSIKVDLSVKEEKISYAENKGLLKDALSIQEVSENAENISDEQPVLQHNLSQPKTTNGNANLMVNGAATPNLATIADENSKTVQNIAVSEVKQASSVTNTSQAIVSGSEFLAAAKAENSGKSNQTSLNDVYKGMSKEAVEQVKVNITKSAVKGVDTIEVRLKPEELGHIEIKMQIKNGKLQAHIISSRPETMEALQRDAQVLEKAFNDAGFQTDSNSLSFSFRNEGNQAQEQSNQLRNFIGKVFEQEANSDVSAAEAANQNWSAENGLNIRV